MTTDDKIQKEVIEEIHKDSQLHKVAAEIGVTVKNNIVSLFGTVKDHTLRIAAEKAARRIKGVSDVALYITLKNTESTNLIGDAEIREAIFYILKAHKEMYPSLMISVENGRVYLEGIVHLTSEKLAAKRLIEKVPGVKSVINKIKIKSSFLKSSEIGKTILAEFEKYPFIDSENIEVEVIEKTVILRGEVASWKETEDAEAISYSMPGIKKVINNLTVDCEIDAN